MFRIEGEVGELQAEDVADVAVHVGQAHREVGPEGALDADQERLVVGSAERVFRTDHVLESGGEVLSQVAGPRREVHGVEGAAQAGQATPLFWEGTNRALPVWLKRFSVTYYLKPLFPVELKVEGVLGPFTAVAEPTPPWLAVSGLLLFATLVLAFACWRVRRLELLYSTD